MNTTYGALMAPEVRMRFEDSLGGTKEGWPILTLPADPYMHLQKGDFIDDLVYTGCPEAEADYPATFDDGPCPFALRRRVWSAEVSATVGDSRGKPGVRVVLTLWVLATDEMIESPLSGNYTKR